MKNSLKIAGLFLISFLALWFAFRDFHFNDLKQAVKNASWIWFLPGTILYLVAHFIRCIRWHFILLPIKKIPPFRLFFALMFGFLGNTVLPLRGGEFLRAYAVDRFLSVPMSSCLGTIAVERLSDLFGLLVVMFIASQLFALEPSRYIVIFMVFVGGIVLLIWLTHIIQSRQEKIKNMQPGSFKKSIQFILDITKGFSSIRSGKQLSLILLLATFVWLTEASVIFLLSRAFHLDLTYTQATALLVGLAIGVMIPAAPGYVGTYEAFGKEALIRLGFSGGISLTFVLVLHFFQLFLSSLFGLPYLIKLGLGASKAKSLNKQPDS